jgi:putative SOS response-associated peptidase YedK
MDASSIQTGALSLPMASTNSPIRRKKGKRKDKWLFTKKDEPIFCIAGIWRETADVGEAFTMLTMEPRPDIAPYHDRQVVIIERDAWTDWLNSSVSAKTLIRPLPSGTLNIEPVG